MAECKYCGKLYHSSKRLTELINMEHTGDQTIFAHLYCSQSFNQYTVYLDHLKEHKDKVIRCRICKKEFKMITKLRKHAKSHVSQCLLCSINFLTPQALLDHMNESHGSKPATVERQCSLCDFTCDSMMCLLNTAKVSITLTVVISVSYIFLQSTSFCTTDEWCTKSDPWVLQWKWVTKVTRCQNCCNLKMLEAPNWWSQPQRSLTQMTRC